VVQAGVPRETRRMRWLGTMGSGGGGEEGGGGAGGGGGALHLVHPTMVLEEGEVMRRLLRLLSGL
jgi:hypothetical protein